MIYILLLLIGVAAVFANLLILGFWIKARRLYKNDKPPSFSPKTCVIVPCKETHERFIENVKAICNQDYKDYIVVFITDSENDTAYIQLKSIINNIPKTRLETADFIEGCSGKIAALIKGTILSNDVDVYVFADSDIKPHTQWLKNLVGNLEEKDVGATTGYRWYFTHNLKSYLISTWNLASVLPFFFPSLNYTWGGSTAIKKSLFNELNIAEKWKKGFADDLILTESIKSSGYKIKFVPKCIIENSSGDDTSNFLEWGTRQFTWVKWYYPSAWLKSFVRLAGVKILIFIGIFLLFIGYFIPGLLMISTFLIEIVYGWQAIVTVKKLSFYKKEKLGRSWLYALLMPIALFVNLYNYIGSVVSTEVTWCGRKYRKKDIKRLGKTGALHEQ
jgi:cellulose synthase/poly-beta-1,6-N-acetylglucosamine synthase-like glycosyltransferase